jgi:hypothetical protein
VVDGCQTDIGGFGRGQEFNMLGGGAHG